MPDNQKIFLELYDKHIKRDGAKKLREYLVESDFFDAPASAKYHCSHDGGLCEHSINTYNRLKKLVQAEYGKDYAKKVCDETIAIAGLLHDVCKIDYYKVDYKNIHVGFDERGQKKWEKQPFYAVEDKLPYGHGEKSVYIINGFIRLSREEAMAINWHMGGFDQRVKGGAFSVGEAYRKFPLATLLHIADMQATYIDENTGLE